MHTRDRHVDYIILNLTAIRIRQETLKKKK